MAEKSMTRKTTKIITVLFGCVFFASAVTAQQLFRWVDEHGVSHFSQTPPPATSEQAFESQELEKKPQVDLQCCDEVRMIARDMAGYMARGVPLTDIHSLVRTDTQLGLTEIANFASDRHRLGMSPTRVGSEAYNSCSNGRLLACRVESIGSSANVTSGSGFWVNSTVVMTNAHVVERCSRITVGNDQTAELLVSDATNDLAAIRVAGASGAPARIRATNQIEHGESVVAAGFPLSGIVADDLNITTGIVSALAGLGGDSRFIQITAPVQQGNSGGPLIDQRGEVIGVVTAKLNAVGIAQRTGDITQNVNFALGLDTLKNFLAQNRISYQIAPPEGAELTVTSISAQARRWTVPVRCEQ